MPDSVISNQDSNGTGKTSERIFPARTLVVKSPSAIPENPFNRLYGLRKAPADDEDSQSRSKAELSPTRSPRAQQPSGEFRDATTPMLKQPRVPSGLAPRPDSGQERPNDHETKKTTVLDASSTVPHEEPVTGDEITTKRFSYVEGQDGSFSVQTDIGPSGITACEDEPIHTPGAIQSFGVLMTLRQIGPNRYQVHHVSEVHYPSLCVLTSC